MSAGRHRARDQDHPVPAGPDLPAFLLQRAEAETDAAVRTTLITLVQQWRDPAPFVNRDDVWDHMVLASRGYRDAPGYREQWSP